MKFTDAGFSLIEVAVSAALTLIVAGAAFALVTPTTRSGRVEPEVVDLQQRVRVGADALVRDLSLAGAGVHMGPATGSLRRFFAPILPRRAGLQGADAFSIARSDAITITYVADTTSQTVLRDPLPSPAADLRVEALPNCAAAGALCGFSQGASLVVFDTVGNFDFFTLTQAAAGIGRVRSWQRRSAPSSYPIGAVVAEATWHTYYLDAPSRQLRHFDGYLTDIPVVDNVVSLAFDYMGDPQPPSVPRPPVGTSNCLYDGAGSPQPGLALLPAQGASLAPLPLALFSDGPWCGAGENRFDADLLRVRMVRVTLRAAASQSAAGRAPEYTVRFDVAPRNLGGPR